MIADGEVLAAVDAQGDAIRETVRFVHQHPELGHEEHECSRYLCETLAAGGLDVDRGVGGMETAFRATLRGAHLGASVGLVCLFDAVTAFRPDGTVEPVHSCGHGPIAGGVIGSALVLAALRDELAGTAVVMGCPADEIHAPGSIERGGGKALSAEAGLWDDLDAALYAHPEFIDTVSLESRWMRRARATVPGSRSLASAANAPLEAAVSALEVARAHVPDDVMLERLELDGDVEEGTGLVLGATFLVFADEERDVDARLAALLRRTRPRLRIPASAAPLRHRLREHLAPLPGRSDRGGPRRRLGLSHGRRSCAVRLRRRRRGGPDDRPGARLGHGPARRASCLAAAQEPSPEPPQHQAQPADRRDGGW